MEGVLGLSHFSRHVLDLAACLHLLQRSDALPCACSSTCSALTPEYENRTRLCGDLGKQVNIKVVIGVSGGIPVEGGERSQITRNRTAASLLAIRRGSSGALVKARTRVAQ